jgi:hypothetical protein
MSKLSDIRPTTKFRLMDLVEKAGIDVSGWKNFKGGRKKAAANPKYCYEWAFVKSKKMVVLNLWHELMELRRDGVVFIEMNPRWFADQRTGTERARSLRADAALQLAVKYKLPIRVIVLGGRRRNSLKEKASHVSSRLLDPVSWTITKYNPNNGDCTVTRGVEKYADQFVVKKEMGLKPQRHKVSGLAFDRSSIVRSNVLSRADGKCEWCGKAGFIMSDDRIYLETHHVIPLSERGLDTESNVAALCPNHHREAHHGVKRAAMRKILLKKIGRHYRG